MIGERPVTWDAQSHTGFVMGRSGRALHNCCFKFEMWWITLHSALPLIYWKEFCSSAVYYLLINDSEIQWPHALLLYRLPSFLPPPLMLWSSMMNWWLSALLPPPPSLHPAVQFTLWPGSRQSAVLLFPSSVTQLIFLLKQETLSFGPWAALLCFQDFYLFVCLYCCHPFDNNRWECSFNKQLILVDLCKSRLVIDALALTPVWRPLQVHAYIISYLKKEMPSLFGREKKKEELIMRLPEIYTILQREHHISPGDFPNVTKMQVQERTGSDVRAANDMIMFIFVFTQDIKWHNVTKQLSLRLLKLAC